MNNGFKVGQPSAHQGVYHRTTGWQGVSHHPPTAVALPAASGLRGRPVHDARRDVTMALVLLCLACWTKVAGPSEPDDQTNQERSHASPTPVKWSK